MTLSVATIGPILITTGQIWLLAAQLYKQKMPSCNRAPAEVQRLVQEGVLPKLRMRLAEVESDIKKLELDVTRSERALKNCFGFRNSYRDIIRMLNPGERFVPDIIPK